MTNEAGPEGFDWKSLPPELQKAVIEQDVAATHTAFDAADRVASLAHVDQGFAEAIRTTRNLRTILESRQAAIEVASATGSARTVAIMRPDEAPLYVRTKLQALEFRSGPGEAHTNLMKQALKIGDPEARTAAIAEFDVHLDRLDPGAKRSAITETLTALHLQPPGSTASRNAARFLAEARQGNHMIETEELDLERLASSPERGQVLYFAEREFITRHPDICEGETAGVYEETRAILNDETFGHLDESEQRITVDYVATEWGFLDPETRDRELLRQSSPKLADRIDAAIVAARFPDTGRAFNASQKDAADRLLQTVDRAGDFTDHERALADTLGSVQHRMSPEQQATLSELRMRNLGLDQGDRTAPTDDPSRQIPAGSAAHRLEGLSDRMTDARADLIRSHRDLSGRGR